MSRSTTSPLLSIKNLSFSPKKSKKILESLNLETYAGELVCITGSNGSGKSTLLSLVMGLEKPNSGELIFNGKDLEGLSITERSKLGISLAFQTPPLLRGLRVRDIVPEKEVLEKLGLGPEYLDRELNSSLSGGERKRIELASVLSKFYRSKDNPQLLLFDEPEAGIDLWTFSKLKNLFLSLKQYPCSIIIVSHQSKLLDAADKIYLLKNHALSELKEER